MNYEKYRRAMDGESLSEEKKALLSSYADAVPPRGNSRFVRRRRRRIISLASLAACFTVICVAGVPLLLAGTMRCGSAAPESTTPTCSNNMGQPGLFFDLFDKNTEDGDLVEAAGEPTPTMALPPTHSTEGTLSPGLGDYQSIYLMVQSQNSFTSDESSSTEELTGETVDHSDLPRPSISVESFSAKAGEELNSIITSDADGGTGAIVFGSDVRVIALFSAESCLAVCAETGSEVTVFVYDVTDVTAPKLLGSFGVTGIFTDIRYRGSAIELVTEFTPTAGTADPEAFIPSISFNSESMLIPPEAITVTHTGTGECTCYVVTKLDISEGPSLVSIRAEFTEK